MDLITCQDLEFAYEGITVTKEVNFSVEKGDYLCIVGENGSGKSTLMRGLLGLKNPIKGTITWADELKRNEVGYLPQQTIVQKDFPAGVYEVVLSGCLNGLGKRLFFRQADKKRALENMEKLDISNLKNKCYRELSGGQQQRVLLARALCATKSILLMDEPVSGLDPAAAKSFYNLIHEIHKNENITIIMVSHDIDYALAHAKHILHLRKTPLFFGAAEDYMQSEIGKKYLGGENHD